MVYLRVMKFLQSIYKLVSSPDYVPAVTAATLLGGAAGGEGSLTRLGTAVFGNLLLYTFAVIYHKVENAPAAAVQPDQKLHNPIASGEVSIKFARTFSAVVVLLCMALAALLGPLNIVLSLLGVLIAIALSHRSLNLGNSPLMRLGRQQPLLAAIMGLSGYLATAQELRIEATLLTIFFLALGFLFAAWTADTTTRLLSKPLLIILFVCASAAAYVLFIVREIIPAGVLLLIALHSSALAYLKHRNDSNQQSLPQILFDSLSISTAVAMIIYYLIQIFF